ncbi:MAG TPA: hypothetical protein VFK48_09180 [Usitatibacter sp.]|nr:hypothetical protein [Usitatibacter sp.]
MRAPLVLTRQALVQAWVAQMIGTIVLCGAVLVFVKAMGTPFSTGENEWKRYAMLGVMLGGIPALAYMRTYKAALNLDDRLERERGVPDPAARIALRRGLTIGGALCEIPMAMGVVQLFFGGDTRWFLGATLVTIALRLSYRPFIRFQKPARAG